jgi:SAM-dependent methyltransferase
VHDPGPAGHAARSLSLRLFQAALATQEAFAAYLGYKLGLYQTLHDGGSATADQLARRAGVSHRYAREWLEQQAVSGVLAVDDASLPPERRAYRLPAGHERVLTASGDPLSQVSTALLPLGGVAGALPALLDAFRSGKGLPPEAFGDDWREGHGGINRAIYTHQLAGWLRGYAPELELALAGGPARVADVGCGAGWASIALARAYPLIRVVGVDVDPDVVAEADANAREAGVADRVTFRVADAAEPAPSGTGACQLVCVFDALHEMARPVEVLSACRAMCAPDGAVLVLEAQVADEMVAPGNDFERFQYATSVLHCLPVGLSGDGAAGTGTVMRAPTVLAHARAAGLHRSQHYDLPDRFHRLYLLRA